MNSSDFASKKLKGRDVSAAPLINNYNNSVSTKEVQKCRTLLPICEAGAPLFLSAVYNKKYTSEKITSRCSQSGRSMIEMLGVLAIIGVLSVGGIAGYSKAMMRYRINKTIEQIALVAGNIRTIFARQGNYAGLATSTDAGRTLLKKARAFPDDMWEDGKLWPQSVYGKNVGLNTATKNTADTNRNKAFCINYNSLPEEVCIELIIHDWSNAQVKMFQIRNEQNSFFGNRTLYLIPPVELENAIKICDVPSDDSGVDEMKFCIDADVYESHWKTLIDSTTTLFGS